MNTLNPEICHEFLMDNIKPILEYDDTRNYSVWRKSVAKKLNELLGEMPKRVPPNLRIEYERETEQYHEKRFIFTSEAYADVPCHLLLPKKGSTPFPVVICLQGHTTGMHISLSRTIYPQDESFIFGGDRDFAIQAVKEGYAALVIEQRCFGERLDSKTKKHSLAGRCHHATMGALLLGRTMVGERVWDVSRAIDILSEFSEIDVSRIACMGNSSGGTITYFASCLDERIKAVMPSCYVCTFEESIGKLHHCECNYIPGILRFFEMGDLACLIAPRPLVVVAGRHDPIFPIKSVEETFEKIKLIYKKAGVPDMCRLVIGEEGHRFYAKKAWPVFREVAGF